MIISDKRSVTGKTGIKILQDKELYGFMIKWLLSPHLFGYNIDLEKWVA